VSRPSDAAFPVKSTFDSSEEKCHRGIAFCEAGIIFYKRDFPGDCFLFYSKEEGDMEDVLSACTVTMNIPVAWGEMDAMGHVNNIIYFRYFETVRIEYFNRLDMLNYTKETGIGPILASTECRYKLPLQYPDTVIAGTKILSMEADRFVMGYEVFSTKTKRLAADGEGVIVTYDYRNNVKVNIPDPLRARIMELEKMHG
jgi:acyl-CoA thioester hydrolase